MITIMDTEKIKKVVVNGYTYETDLDLEVGDEVVLPTPSWLLDVNPPNMDR